MPEQSRREHEEDLEVFTASFVCNVIRNTADQDVPIFILDMLRNEKLDTWGRQGVDRKTSVIRPS
jgi:hypothetical protein